MDINPQMMSNTSIFDLQRSTTDETGKQKVKVVASQFAEVFVNEMLQSARKAKLGDGLMESNQTQLANKLYFQQLSTNLTQNNSLGVTGLLTQQLEYQEKTNGKA